MFLHNSYVFPTAITINNKIITNPSDIANVFNNYLSKVAIDFQKIYFLLKLRQE